MQSLLLLAGAATLLLPSVVETCTTDSLNTNLNDLVRISFVSSSGQRQIVDVLSIDDQQTVCLSTGRMRGTYRWASMILDVNCTGSACPAGRLQQFEFICDPEGTMMWFNPTDNYAPPEGADLTTSLRTDCGQCRRLTSSSPLHGRYDNVTHCVECSPSCNTGLRECFSINDGDCCSAVENNVCVSNCPAPGRPQASASYTCTIFCDSLAPSLNGVIRQSDGDLLNSVATYSCDMNYELQGSANRTCVIIGKTTAWSGTAPSCMTDPITCGTLEEGANQIISYIDNCTVKLDCQAIYSCDENYELKGGATIRTCSLPSDGIPVWSGIVPTCEEQSNSLTKAEIAGIGIAAAVVVSAIIIAIVVIVIVVLSRQ